jgi:Arc/MetJ-type ribon-helix-helix transcriptional regulator
MNIMTINLPKEVESSILAEVHSGHFASVDDAVTAAWHAFLRQEKPRQAPPQGQDQPDPFLGSMRDAADELDEIVADAMKRRQEEPWRVIPGE